MSTTGTAPEATLLVVEDETNIRELLTTSLRFAGFAVHAAADGRSALQLAGEHEIDLAVLDIMLPDMDGFTVLLEGGPTLAGAFWRAGCVDELLVYLAPALLGAGAPAVPDLGVRTIGDAVRLEIADVTRVGPDLRLRLVPTAPVQDHPATTQASPASHSPSARTPRSAAARRCAAVLVTPPMSTSR